MEKTAEAPVHKLQSVKSDALVYGENTGEKKDMRLTFQEKNIIVLCKTTTEQSKWQNYCTFHESREYRVFLQNNYVLHYTWKIH